MLDGQKYNIYLKEYLKFQKGVHVWLVQELYWMVLLRPGHTGPNARIMDGSRTNPNSHVIYVFRSSFVRGSASYAIAGFERFKTLLRVQIDVVLRDQLVSNVIDAILTRFVRDSCAECQCSFAEISDNRVG